MANSRWLILVSALVCLGAHGEVLAGMPSPQLVLTELGKRRMEELSFFLVGFLLMAVVVWWLWNYLQVEIPALPRLTYRRTVALLLLWGLVMTVVLSLVSGARELMTPAAWVPDGVTYKLKSGQSPEAQPDLIQQRQKKLEQLRTALWQFAATHDGDFPGDSEVAEIPDATWLAQPGGKLKFVYVAGQSAKSGEAILVYEPELYDDGQFVLMTSGRIAKLTDVPFVSSEK